MVGIVDYVVAELWQQLVPIT